MPTSMLSAKDVTVDLLIRYGFQVLGALVILAVGALVARWAGGLLDRQLAARRSSRRCARCSSAWPGSSSF